jgi:TonB family protein
MTGTGRQEPPRITFEDSLDPELLRALVLSLGVHIAVIAAVVAWPDLVGQAPAATRPVYTVALVSAADDSAILSIGPLARSAPVAVPKARPAPKIRRLVDTKPAPKVVLKELPAVKPKAQAPAPPKKIRAQPPPPVKVAKATTEPSQARPAKPAVRAWQKAGGETRAPEFVSYYEQMLDSIKNHWVWVGDPAGDLAVTVRFGITEAGRLSGLRLVSSSGDGLFDRSVLAAVDSAAPLGSPPPAHRTEFADVEIVFKAEELEKK